MNLTVTGRTNDLTRKWADALIDVQVRHPDRRISLLVTLEDYLTPMIHFELDTNVSSNTDLAITPFRIGNVKLTYFPGIRAARSWIAAAWACFMLHEAVELVTVGGIANRVMDPHESRETLEYPFHTGLPYDLTPDTLLASLLMITTHDRAMEIINDQNAQ